MQSLFVLLLFTGIFHLILSVPRKFYLITEPKTWSEAQAYCQANNTDLATIESSDDLLQLQSVANSQQFTSSAWIGLYNSIESWHWSLGDMPLGTLRNWAPNQPDNHNGEQECVLMKDGFWSDKKCTDPKKFLCFDDKIIGSEKYILVSEKMSWHDAQSYCRKWHTDLASVRDTEEDAFIKTRFTGDELWFGLFRDSWKWIDQANVSSIPWKNGQPDNNHDNEDCGFLLSNQAEDNVCSDKMPFFCYSVITGQKQIIRMKVQSEQDVNNSEVKAAIMEKIKETLKEHGVENNVTVMWIKQPDGKVFRMKKEKKWTPGR